MEKGLGAQLAAVGAVVVAVETAMQLQVDVLGELGVAYLALVRFFSRVQTLVRLQIAGAAEPFVTNLKGRKTLVKPARRWREDRLCWFSVSCSNITVRTVREGLNQPGIHEASLLCGPGDVSGGGPAE